ncbi:restriction endonuclease subunit S [Sedimentitalea nanhaiensis]|uniref:Type I restriction enzyme, S subunit n=1 Tax=Sedimentitalea nanhaiensis TaxID=999627 RepID=A0A1I7E484_9RHOB|nr:restriction endonuclease subunit S [Sedimentitalea nanhaiensis]SFU18643.1 type I restriction enzyme, S subunit [Sedimentitalea nanhaiensis]
MHELYKKLPLAKVAKIERGKFSARPRNDPKYYGGDIPFIQTGDVARAGRTIHSWTQTLNELGLGVSKMFPRGTIFMSIAANIGDVAISGFDAACPDSVVAVKPLSKIDPEWMFQTLKYSKNGLAALSTQNAQANLSIEKIEPFKVHVPPFPEQQKIAAILRTWDEALEKLNALRALNIRRRIWLRTQLFTGKVRLPGFTDEWRTVPLSDVLHEHSSKSTGAEEVYSVSVHKGLVNQVEHLGRSFSAASTDHYNRVLPGDIVYTKSPTGDFPLGIIKQSKIDREVIVSPLYGVFTPQSYALGVILDALFESPLAARNYLHPLVQKGAKNTIAVTNKQFLEGKLHLPMSPDEQAAIADVVNTSHAELACLDAEIKALTDQKRGLMQKLLTGEWHVEVSDDEEAAA